VTEAAGLTQAAPYVATHEQLTPKDWAFYSFNVTADDYQVVVNVDAENDTQCASGKGQDTVRAGYLRVGLLSSCCPPTEALKDVRWAGTAVAAHAARRAPCAVRARSARGRAPCWSASLAGLRRCVRRRHQPGLHRPVRQVRPAAGVALRAVGLSPRVGLLLGARQRPGGPLRRLAQRLADRCGPPPGRARSRSAYRPAGHRTPPMRC